jgi:hypothetical protein
VRKLLTITVIALSFFILQDVQTLAGSPPDGGSQSEKDTFFESLEKTVQRDPIRLEDIYYYDREGNYVRPEISTKRIGVIFTGPLEWRHIKCLLQKSKLLEDGYITEKKQIITRNIYTETTIIFELKDGCTPDEVISVLNTFNNLEPVKVASPVFIIDGEELMLNGVFEMKVKKERPDRGRIARLQDRLGVTGKGPSPKDSYVENYEIKLKGVEVKGINFFRIVNHFKEDTDVVYATPLFKGAYPPVDIKQEVPITFATIGVRLPYRIIINRNSSVTIDQSSMDKIDMRLFPESKFARVEVDEYEKKDIIEGQKLVITGRVWFLAPDEYRVPQKKVVYVTKEGERKIAETHDDILIKIASLVPKKSKKGFIALAALGEYRPGIVDKALNKTILYGGLSLASLAGIAALVIFSFVIPWVKASKAKVTVDPVAESLKGFEEAIQANGESKQYFSNVNERLRRLLDDKTGVNVKSGAVQKVVEKLNKEDKSLAEKIGPILEKCEEVLSKPDGDYSHLKSALITEAKELVETFFKAK